jgi:hypothetical protein
MMSHHAKFMVFSDGSLGIANPFAPMHIVREVFSRHFREIETGLQLRATLRAGSTTDLGGYPLYFVVDDGEALCFKCVRSELRQITSAIRAGTSDRGGWRVIGCDVNYEDPDLTCAHCNERIRSTYAEGD